MDFLTKFVSVTEAAEIRGVSRQAVLKAIAAGRLRAAKVGNQWVIERKDLASFTPHAGGTSRKRKSKTGST
jgi:excisionase family DNA binding protein